MACFFDFIIGSFIFVGLMIYYKVALTLNFFWIPLIVIIQIILTLGVGLISGALNVFFRDIKYIIPLTIQIWMYLSPIIYPVSLIPKKYMPFYMLNPMVSIIDSYRKVILNGVSPDLKYLFISFIISTVVFIFAYVLFKKAEGNFADVI